MCHMCVVQLNTSMWECKSNGRQQLHLHTRHAPLITHTAEAPKKMGEPHLKTEISFVVGKMPSARNLRPSSALITLLLPLLNSPTTATRNGSSN